MSQPAVLIASAKLRRGQDEAFAAWKAHHDTVIGKFAGFLSSDIIPPTNPDGNEWIIILNFQSKEDLTVWQQSQERAALIAEGLPLFEGGNLGEFAPVDQGGEYPDSSVTEVVFSKVKAGMEDTYREWAGRIQAAQAKHPGYRGMFLQPPDEKGGIWTTIIRFETAGQLEAWMNAPERRELLRESKAFIEHEQLTRLATSFPGWVPLDPMTGKGPPNWKTAMLVLLGLFPIVMLELRFLNPILTGWGLNSSFATFIGNAGSVAATSFFTMPLAVRGFGWWLFPKVESAAISARGVMILALFYAGEIALLWKLLPW
jgi:antibiotic biosynthesis monooxygenase (ABM) superfamily enzyme